MGMGMELELAGDARGRVGHPEVDPPPPALHRGEQHQAAAAADPKAAIAAGLGPTGAAHRDHHRPAADPAHAAQPARQHRLLPGP